MSTGGEGHMHVFAESGWCTRCNLRDDGRLIGKGGDIFRPGPEYTPEQLREHRNRLENQDAHA